MLIPGNPTGTRFEALRTRFLTADSQLYEAVFVSRTNQLPEDIADFEATLTLRTKQLSDSIEALLAFTTPMAKAKNAASKKAIRRKKAL